jgi:hypothetical protein
MDCIATTWFMATIFPLTYVRFMDTTGQIKVAPGANGTLVTRSSTMIVSRGTLRKLTCGLYTRAPSADTHLRAEILSANTGEYISIKSGVFLHGIPYYSSSMS